MPKKSRKTAARYSELSKGGKKKQKAKGPAQAEFQAETEIQPEIETETQAQPQPEVEAQKKAKSQTVSVSTSREAVQPRGARGPLPRVRSEAKLAASGSELVRSDLKRIGILAGIMLIILIILAFTLG